MRVIRLTPLETASRGKTHQWVDGNVRDTTVVLANPLRGANRNLFMMMVFLTRC
jgi:hypothetical protein